MINIVYNDTDRRLAMLNSESAVTSDSLIGKWVHLTNPDDREVERISALTGIPEESLKAALDEEERARIENEDGCLMILIDVPVIEEDDVHDYYTYTTLPMGIIQTKGYFVTVCLRENAVINDFFYGRVKNADVCKTARLIFQMLYVISTKYLQYLRQINKASQRVQSTLERSMKNKELLEMMDLQKSLVYFSTSIAGNDSVIEKLTRQNLLKKYEEDQDLIEDVAIENKQAAEMCAIYRDILVGTMDAYGSIISNNLNMIMKLMTALTLVLSVPMLIASLFGMNLGGIPGEHSIWGFGTVCVFSFVVAIVSGIFLVKKKMF